MAESVGGPQVSVKPQDALLRSLGSRAGGDDDGAEGVEDDGGVSASPRSERRRRRRRRPSAAAAGRAASSSTEAIRLSAAGIGLRARKCERSRESVEQEVAEEDGDGYNGRGTKAIQTSLKQILKY